MGTNTDDRRLGGVNILDACPGSRRIGQRQRARPRSATEPAPAWNVLLHAPDDATRAGRQVPDRRVGVPAEAEETDDLVGLVPFEPLGALTLQPSGTPGLVQLIGDFAGVGATLVERHGSGPKALVMIPGLASGPWAWQHAIAPTDELRYSITFRNLRED